MLVTDTGNNRVVRSLAAGALEASCGGAGSTPGEFSDPIGIAVGTDGRLLVCDLELDTVALADAPGRSGLGGPPVALPLSPPRRSDIDLR